MAAAKERAVAASNRNKAIVGVTALCNRLSLDPKKFSSEGVKGKDILGLFSSVLRSPQNDFPLKNETEVMKWVTFASSFPSETDACHATLKGLNEDLNQRTVLLGDGLKPSEADIVVFSSLHSFVSHLTNTDMQKYPNVIRWMDYIQNKEDFGGALGMIVIKKPEFEFFRFKSLDKLDCDTSSKKVALGSKDANNSEVLNPKKVASEKKGSTINDKASGESAKSNKIIEEKKKPAEKESADKETDGNITILNIQVGIIRKAWKHPSADSLLVEEIDLGDGNLRQVVSGLAKYCSPDELSNRRVVLITNVKPGKLRDVMSAGLVLCASNHDHTVVEPLIPPEGASIGERISFSGICTLMTRVWQRTKGYHSRHLLAHVHLPFQMQASSEQHIYRYVIICTHLPRHSCLALIRMAFEERTYVEDGRAKKVLHCKWRTTSLDAIYLFYHLYYIRWMHYLLPFCCSFPDHTFEGTNLC